MSPGGILPRIALGDPLELRELCRARLHASGLRARGVQVDESRLFARALARAALAIARAGRRAPIDRAELCLRPGAAGRRWARARVDEALADLSRDAEEARALRRTARVSAVRSPAGRQARGAAS